MTTSTNRIIPQDKKENYRGAVLERQTGAPSVRLDDTDSEPQGTASLFYAGAGVEVAGVVGGASSVLDYCDQVSKNTPEKRSWVSEKEVTRRFYKDKLAVSLRACGRDNEAEAVTMCGEDFKVGKCVKCGSNPAFPITCDHRLCSDCASRRGARLVAEHEDVLRAIHYPKMLTLTFLSVEHLDKSYIKWARNCFRKLRRRKVMATCWGGIYSFEVTHSDRFGWHLHIHALIGSGFIDKDDLHKEWQSITGASMTGIEAVRTKNGYSKWSAVKEVVKYPTKVATFVDNSDLVDEFLSATERVNLAYGFGALYRVKTKRRGDSGMRCPVCGSDDIDFGNGMGFLLPRSLITKIEGGYVWRSPPAGPPAGPLAGGPMGGSYAVS